METFLSVIQVALSIIVIFLVLLHSGKDAGLSGAFGIGGAGGGIGLVTTRELGRAGARGQGRKGCRLARPSRSRSRSR